MARAVSPRPRVAPSRRARRVGRIAALACALACALAGLAALDVARAHGFTTDRDAHDDEHASRDEHGYVRRAVEVSETATGTLERDVALSSVTTSSDGREVSFSIVDYEGASGRLDFELAHAEARWEAPLVVRIEANGERSVVEREEVETALGCMYEGEVTETGTGRRWGRGLCCATARRR